MNSSWLSATWRAMIVRGVIAIGIGILALIWPGLTVITLALVWGVWALVDGGMSIFQVFSSDASMGSRVGWGILGAVAVIAGLFAIIRPGVTVVVLTWMLGIWLIVRGVVELVAAFSRTTAAPRWLLVVAAVVDALLGILFVANPGASALAVATVLGLFTVIWGIAVLFLGIVVRRELKASEASVTA